MESEFFFRHELRELHEFFKLNLAIQKVTLMGKVNFIAFLWVVLIGL
jgi:hypothetical protein